MTIRKVDRSGTLHWVIDIQYKTADGKRDRFRRDAQVQTKGGAEAEHRRLVVELAKTGTLRNVNAGPEAEQEEQRYTFGDAVRHFRATHMQSALKPSTRASYDHWLEALLEPRFQASPLESVNGNELAELDAELVKDELAPSTRGNIHSVFRSVLRTAVRAGMLGAMPALPRLPKVGRKVVKPMRRDDLEAIIGSASPSARRAFELAAFAGLRACEVRGLRRPDVDLKARTVTIRRGITRGIETTPKSHHHRVVPIGPRLCASLEAGFKEKAGPWASVALTERGKPWGEFGLNQAFKRAQKRANRSGWSFHDLRHFFVTELFRSGASAVAIQQLAGHSDLATTQRYADLDGNDLRSAIERIDGGNSEETPSGDTRAGS